MKIGDNVLEKFGDDDSEKFWDDVLENEYLKFGNDILETPGELEIMI